MHQMNIKSGKQRVDLAVVGGGPKAAALAARAYALREIGLADLNVTIFEQFEIGSAWTGKHGYTDGKQRLCTPSERDVGFPYTSIFGNDFAKKIYDRFSWASYLLAQRENNYRLWIDRGRRPADHGVFSKYLKWVVERSEATVVSCKVSRLAPKNGKWAVHGYVPSRNQVVKASADVFDGAVISGPGPPRRVPILGDARRVLDGRDFWLRLSDVRKTLKKAKKGDEVVIIGAGGTAASVLAWLTKNEFKDIPIVLVADQAALFTRGDSYFENNLFTDEEAWQALSTKSRKEFFDRLNRGVVWASVMDDVSSATNLTLVNGRATQVQCKDDEIDLTVLRCDGLLVSSNPILLVDASGFDPWWFLELLPIIPKGKRGDRRFRESMRARMGQFLNLPRLQRQLPPIHVPFLSSNLGPGFGSLMALGAMADNVVNAYVSRTPADISTYILDE
jgi:mycobactin lysine-N-oxygenase